MKLQRWIATSLFLISGCTPHPSVSTVQTSRPLPGQDNTADCRILSGGANINGTMYKVKQISPGKCVWVENVEGEQSIRAEYKRRADLFNALTHRALTSDELKEAAAYGDELNHPPDGTPYYENELNNQLQLAWTIQQTLQMKANNRSYKK